MAGWTVIYCLLFATEGRYSQVLLGLVFFVKKNRSIWVDPAARAARLRDALCLGWNSENSAPSAPNGRLPLEIPTLIVSATQDAIAPHGIVDGLIAIRPDASVVRVIDGPHVSTGRGDPCVDAAMVDFLTGRPVDRTECAQPLLAPYIPLATPDLDAYASALDVVAAAELELYLLPEYQAWARQGTLSVGCPVSGAVTYEAAEDDGVAIGLRECELMRGMPMSGTGELNEDGSIAEFQLAYPGSSVAYGRIGNSRTLEGAVDGEPVRLTE